MVEFITWKGMDMKPSRFTEEKIIVAVLREHEAGAKTADLRASTASRKPRCTTGRPNTAASRCRTRSV